MPHYIYTKEGVAGAKGIDIARVEKYKKRALSNGFQPSKIIGGIEYFDFDELFMLNTHPLVVAIKAKKQVSKKRGQGASRTQLSFSDIYSFF